MSRLSKKWQTPGVVFQPSVYEGLRVGIDTIVNAIRPTLGPFHGNVVIEKESKVGRPEILDDGAIIARRIIKLANREEDMGAMYLRHMLWKMHEKVGDGTATAAVIFHTIYNEGLRYILAGGNVMQLRACLEETSEILLKELEGMSIHLHGKEQFSRMAETICYDPALANMLGEIFDVIGEDGRLEIRPGRSRELEREYIEGMYWDGGVFSREMIHDLNTGMGRFENAAILISDLEIKNPHDMVSFMELVIRSGYKSLLLVASVISDQALSVILANRGKIEVIATKAPAMDIVTRKEALEDLALLTGGRALFHQAGETLNSVHIADLGQARRVWATSLSFGIVGGKGDARALRQHIAKLRARLNSKDVNGFADYKYLQTRLGRLMGGTATLQVGDATPLAIEARTALAERTASAMRGAIREGVLPGGGIAFLGCQQILRKKLKAAENLDEQAAYKILLKAFEMPIRVLLENAGYESEKILHQITLAGPGYGFDLKQAQVVKIDQFGIYDAASVVKAAMFGAIHGASLALTIDVLIHRRNPPDGHTTT